MSMVINTNVMATTVSNNLAMHYQNLQSSTERLSTGLRINSAADDAAGLAIRELMRADIASLNQGIRNANDAISLLQTADGALDVVDSLLIRMKELAEQAATGTYNSTQRGMISSEYQAMAEEITRIANATDFNGIHLLNGNLSSGVHDGSGLTSTGKMKIHFGTSNDSAEDYYFIQIGDCTASALGFSPYTKDVTTTTVVEDAGYDGAAYVVNAVNAVYAAGGDDSDMLLASVYAKNDVTLENGYSDDDVDAASDVGQAVYDAITSGADADAMNAAAQTAFATFYTTETSTETLTVQADITTQNAAQEALLTVDNAIISKDTIRANIGALQNRLEATVDNLTVQMENLQAAESRISDTDIATEMTSFVRNQILVQSAVAMLTQANSMPQMALQLIG